MDVCDGSEITIKIMKKIEKKKRELIRKDRKSSKNEDRESSRCPWLI